MTWFKVDDEFHSHPKVLATDPAALGLWVVAGSWSSAHRTGGKIPDSALPRLCPDAIKLAEDLVDAGLWERTRTGFKFHDWKIFNPTSKQAARLHQNRVDAGRLGGFASGVSRANARSKNEASASLPASGTVEPPTRPDPYMAEVVTDTTGSRPQPVDKPRFSRSESQDQRAVRHPSNRTVREAIAAATPSDEDELP